ncbi:MAG: dTDP-4-dehydrorhamnose reductase [Bacteroidetes bacterium]|nr:dTDP-4-dehydrorhamnose reductase [Bacteroidota bacterium]
MSKILVTGSNGQLGRSIKSFEALYPDCDFIFTDIDELNICNPDQIDQFLQDKRFDYLINCAAYTAVDQAETDYKNALMLNGTACLHLAEACKKHIVSLLHISTDFVFDGTKNQPYTETDVPNPISAYGRSKLVGENHIQQLSDDFIIIRTAWLYSDYGHNFVHTIRKYGREKGSLQVVHDQLGSPTYASDLALVILEMINQDCPHKGFYHYTNEGVISWYEFANEIIQLSGINCEVNAIPGMEYPTAATRPAYSVLDTTKIKKDYELEIPFWRNSLIKCIENLKKESIS